MSQASIDGRDHGGHGLEAEFEHEPVPAGYRHRTRSVAAVWFGFPMILTNAVFGGIITYNLGFWPAIGAAVAGNAVLFAYVGALSYLSGTTGMNFALLAKRTFGTKGYVAASAFLAAVVVGWYAFQTGLTGAIINAAFGWNATVVIVVATVLYTGVTFIGIRALSIIGLIAAPLYVVLGLVALWLIGSERGLDGIWTYSGQGSAMSFGSAVTLVIATFADSGTMTADFTRWAKDGRSAVAATITAFPVANLTAMLFGIVIVAAGAAGKPETEGGDFLPILTAHGGVLAAIALVFVFVNLGSVCTHCLYNGAMGWSHLLGSRMRVLTLALGLLGGALALAGVWSLFLAWLNLLGIFVPPIGAVMIVDQLLTHGADRRAPERIRLPAFAAWAIGAGAAVATHYLGPQYCEALVGLVVGAGVYAGLLAYARRETAVAT